MNPGTILPNPTLLKLDRIVSKLEQIKIVVWASPPVALCPDCGREAFRIHSRYLRTLADIPWQGVVVHLEIHARKFFCDNLDCGRKIFTERLPGVALPYARRTLRRTSIYELMGVMSGGEGGARILRKLQMGTSPDTILRTVRRITSPAVETPRCLGVDDFAFRRGTRYGTILVDLEHRKVIDLLEDREAETLKKWLQAHPGVEIITRDWAGASAQGATEGAPEAIQICDRWQLIKNLGEALERVLNRCHQVLAEVVKPESPPPLALLPTPGTDHSPSEGVPTKPNRRERDQTDRRQQRVIRFENVVELSRQGIGIRQISRQTGLSRGTIRTYLAADVFPEIARRPLRPGILTPFLEFLEQRWAAGCRNGVQLWKEVIERGFRGSYVTIQRFCAKRFAGLSRTQRQGSSLLPLAKPPPLSPRRARWLLMLDLHQLTEDDLILRHKLMESSPLLNQSAGLVQTFLTLLRTRDLPGFHRWEPSVRGSHIHEFQSFLNGIERDRAAVEAAFRYEFSNGQTEGQVNRLKVIKRQGFGRAKFDLLRQRVLYEP